MKINYVQRFSESWKATRVIRFFQGQITQATTQLLAILDDYTFQSTPLLVSYTPDIFRSCKAICRRS